MDRFSVIAPFHEKLIYFAHAKRMRSQENPTKAQRRFAPAATIDQFRTRALRDAMPFHPRRT
jgi:hypothetical protein